jgi:hypothetical protein
VKRCDLFRVQTSSLLMLPSNVFRQMDLWVAKIQNEDEIA